MAFTRFYIALLLLLPVTLRAAGLIYEPAFTTPPSPPREFRGAWLATVGNIDWPSKEGLTVEQQKAELISLLDRAAQLKLNAIIFQVRPSSDALYPSAFEPWSEYITGRMGQGPQPAYDPLALAIEEAHKCGLELHAWFNPFRARHSQAKSPVSANHISRTHPELVHNYGDDEWLDPGEPAVQAHVLRVVMDVVKRYDVDGVQLDDYFYPYPVKDAQGREVDFPDTASFLKYGYPHGYDRANWRRQNINTFVHTVYVGIKSTKPWVKFGISPFGIWQPFFPASVRGFNSYTKLYADARMWLANGWVDYLSPQLYWAVNSPQQSFPDLLGWWQSQNVMNRNLWPGLYDANIGVKFTTNEIARQIAVTRQMGANGTVHFHLRTMLDNPALNESLRSMYAEPALVPASPWLEYSQPETPKLTVTTQEQAVHLEWQPGGSKAVRNWVLQAKIHGLWQTEILPAREVARNFTDATPEALVLSAVDQAGNLSRPVSLAPKKPKPPHRKGLYN